MIKKTGCVFLLLLFFFYLTQKDIYQKKKKINSKLIKEVKKTRLNSTYSVQTNITELTRK